MNASGEQSSLTDRAASLHLGSVPITILDGVDVLHVPLDSLLAGALAESTQQVLGEAIEQGIAVTLSTSSVAALREFGRSEFLALVKSLRPSIVFSGREEARYALQGHPWFVGAGATVVTAGVGAARFTKPDGSDFRKSPDEIDVVDTTGAGDAFTAGFLVAWRRGGAPLAWLESGHRSARRHLSLSLIHI